MTAQHLLTAAAVREAAHRMLASDPTCWTVDLTKLPDVAVLVADGHTLAGTPRNVRATGAFVVAGATDLFPGFGARDAPFTPPLSFWQARAVYYRAHAHQRLDDLTHLLVSAPVIFNPGAAEHGKNGEHA